MTDIGNVVATGFVTSANKPCILILITWAYVAIEVSYDMLAGYTYLYLDLIGAQFVRHYKIRYE